MHALESDFCELMNPQVPERDRLAVVDLLAQLCRLVLDMCNVAIVPPSKDTQEEFNFNQLFNSGPAGDGNCKLISSVYFIVHSNAKCASILSQQYRVLVKIFKATLAHSMHSFSSVTLIEL